jgi:GAF domain-containing protein
VQANKEIAINAEGFTDKLFFHSAISRIRVLEEEKEGVLLTLTDITELKHTEEELKKRQSELSALFTVSSAISQTIDISKLFPIILDTITSLKMFDVEPRGGIFIIEGNSMELVSHAIVSEDFLHIHKDMKVGDCLCGLAAKTGEIIISGNSHEDSARHTFSYKGMPEHGHIIIPLTSRKIVIGVLCLYLPPDIDIDESNLNLLISMRNHRERKAL